MADHSQRLLCLINDPTAATVTLSVAERLDYEAVVVETTTELLEKSRQQRYDVYLLSLGALNGDRAELPRQLRALNPSAQFLFFEDGNQPPPD